MDRKPLVSVIINCYNGAKLLNTALDSVISQSYSNWEIIFWDNRSNDNSRLIVESYADPRIKYFLAEEHTSLGEARSLALNKSAGDFISFLDCDDFWLKEKLKIQLDHFALNKSALLCYGGIRILNDIGEVITLVKPRYNTGYIFDNLLDYFDINMITPMIRRSVIDEYNLTFDNRIFASEEVDLFLKIAYYGEVICIKEILACAHVSANSLTSKALNNWHKDLKITIDSLLQIDESIRNRSSFRKIKAKYYYYESRYYLNQSQRMEAINSGIKAVNLDYKYWSYTILLFTPFIGLILRFYEGNQGKYILKERVRQIMNIFSKRSSQIQ